MLWRRSTYRPMPPAAMRTPPAIGSRRLAVVPPTSPRGGLLTVPLPIPETAVLVESVSGLMAIAVAVLALGKVGGALVDAVSVFAVGCVVSSAVLVGVAACAVSLLGTGVCVAVGVGVLAPVVAETAVAETAVAVALAVGSGVMLQTAAGVGFHAAPGVGVLPLRVGGDTSGTLPVKPCTCTVKSATQPCVPSGSWMSHQGALAARPTIGRTSLYTNWVTNV